MLSKGKRLYDKDNNSYTVVGISGRMTILMAQEPKEYVVTRPLQLDSEGYVILDRLGVWWCWTYSDAIRLVEYIKDKG